MKSQKLNIKQKYLFGSMLLLAVVLMPLRLVEAEVTLTVVEPKSGTNTPRILLGGTFTLQLQIDTGEVEVLGLEVYLTFDPNVLEVQGEKPFTAGDFFAGGTEIFNRKDGSKLDYKIQISPAKKGSGTIASLTFKAISLALASPIRIDFEVDRNTQVTDINSQILQPIMLTPIAKIFIQPTIITLIQPNGGEILKVGTPYNIVWTSIGKEINHVKILYSTDGGKTYPNTIVEKAPHNPENPLYGWTISATESKNVKIKIIAYDSTDKNLAEDESDNTFEIRIEAAVSLKIPYKQGYPKYSVTVPIELKRKDPNEPLSIFGIALTLKITSGSAGLLKLRRDPRAVEKTPLTADWSISEKIIGDDEVRVSLASSKALAEDGALVELFLNVASGKGGETATLSLSQAELNDGAISVETAPGKFEVYVLGVTPEKITLQVGETHSFKPIHDKGTCTWKFSSDVPCGKIDNIGAFTALGDWMKQCSTLPPKGTVTVTDSTGRVATAEVTVTLRYGDVDGSGEVDAEDAGVTLDSTVELVILSKCERKASDVDCNLKVTPLDVSYILRFIVDIIPELPVGPCLAPPKSSAQVGEIYLGTFQEQSASIVTVPVLIKGLDRLLSGKLVLSYNPQEVAFVEVEPTLLTKDYLFAHNAASGQLTVAFAGATQPEQDGELLHLNFKKTSSNSLRGIDSIVLSEAKLNDGNLRAVLHKVTHHQLPSRSELLANFPNPFNPETWVPYQLAEAGQVTIEIYTLTGQLVRRFLLGHKEAGYYLTEDKALHWDGKNQLGEPVGSGVYFYSIETPEFRAMKKMLLLK